MVDDLQQEVSGLRAALDNLLQHHRVIHHRTPHSLPCEYAEQARAVLAAPLASLPEIDEERLARALHLVGPYHYDHHIEGVPQPCEEMARNVAAAYSTRRGGTGGEEA